MLAVEFKNLDVKLGNNLVLKEISFEIEEGGFVSILGPNGGGKTTLLKVLLGLVSPTNGTCLVFGLNPEKIKFNQIGYVPQIKTLDRTFPAIPLDLVATGISGNWNGKINSKIKELAEEALGSVGVGHLSHNSINTLSGGELQRVFLARSLVRKPKLLILDEPATGIDFIAEKDFSNLIDKYRAESGATVITVTHDWEQAFHHSEKVVLLNRKLICYDVPERAFCHDTLEKTFGHIGHRHGTFFIHNSDTKK